MSSFGKGFKLNCRKWLPNVARHTLIRIPGNWQNVNENDQTRKRLFHKTVENLYDPFHSLWW